jgi:tetratricopeptide (TPR) repeat protein
LPGVEGGVAALFEEANALLAQARRADALRVYDALLALEPGHDAALALDAFHPRAQHGRAAALIALGRFAEGLAACERLLALAPSSFEALCNLAAALNGLERHEEALRWASAGLALRDGRRAHAVVSVGAAVSATCAR